MAAGREYVSKAEALTRFRREFAELASLTSGFDDNPFPASIEVRVRPEAERDGRADALVQRIAALPGVADVRYDQRLAGSRRRRPRRRSAAAGLALALLMALAAAVTVATVVRLGLHARRDEIEIMELVGAPLAFIRGPFVAEGFLQGGLGALLALASLWLGFAGGQGLVGGRISAACSTAGRVRIPAVRLCAVPGGRGDGGRQCGGLAACRGTPGLVTEAAGLDSRASLTDG